MIKLSYFSKLSTLVIVAVLGAALTAFFNPFGERFESFIFGNNLTVSLTDEVLIPFEADKVFACLSTLSESVNRLEASKQKESQIRSLSVTIDRFIAEECANILKYYQSDRAINLTIKNDTKNVAENIEVFFVQS